MESEFPSNSHKQKDPAKTTKPKKIEKITTGPVIRRKKPLGKRLAETFTGGDSKGVWSYVMYDVLIPAAKDMMADATSQGVEKMLFGEARSAGRRTGQRPGGLVGHVAYNRYAPTSSINRRDEPRSMSRRARANHDFGEVVLATRVEAEEVVDRLFAILAEYEVVTVAELYEMVDVPAQYTDDKYGWVDLRSAGVTRVRDGYLLDLPRPEPLD